jgi:cytochrome P450
VERVWRFLELQVKPEPDAATGPDPGHDWDPSLPVHQDNPFAIHRELRAKCPVAHSNQWGGFWTLTKYEDIRAVGVDKDHYTATVRTIVPSSPKVGLPRLPLQADAPQLGVYRKALSPWFSDPYTNRLEPAVRALASDLLTPLIGGHEADVVGGFTEPFTVRALCLFLGMSDAEADRLKDLSIHYVEAIQAQDLKTAAGLSREIDGFAISLVEDRKAHPGDPRTDVTTGLLQMEKFTDTEVAGMVRLSLIGGHIVPKNFLGSVLRHFAENPAHVAMLRDKPELIADAIEEMLRLYSPNQALARTTTCPVEVRGKRIEANQPVAMLFLSANRDEDIFEAPDEFRLGRKQKHIAFGYGQHSCIGQQFARMQARVTVEELLRRIDRIEIAGPVQNAVWPEYGVAGMRARLYPHIA